LDAPVSQKDRDDISRVLARITAAWTECRFDELHDCFNENVVIVSPDLNRRVEGRDACIASYRDFMSQAQVDAYHEDPPTIDIWNDTAVAAYRWTMHWSMGGQSHDESGHDIFAFARRDGKWRAVWRLLLPADSPA
jgi:hypothetical protein